MSLNRNKTCHPNCAHAALTFILMCTLTLGALYGCDDSKDNYLEGSVTAGYDMKFDDVRVVLYPESALSIEYVKKTKNGDQLPLRVTIDYPEDTLTAGREYNLLTECSIVRGVDYASSPLPALESGTVRLDEFTASDGSKVSGDFEAVFIERDGAKINLRGGFSADIDRFEQ
ncbi:MAG: hypothetical protein JXX14_23600 [Deltaproteobacteria bacterium]|nr:hypothetical protein [Deltaproteobacteria bacterium]